MANAMSLFNLDGRNAIVTGGAQGLAVVMATALLDAGAKVTLWDIDGKKLEETVRELSQQYKGKCEGFEIDLKDEEKVEEMTKRVVDKQNHIDILVNSAARVQYKPATEISFDEWQGILHDTLSTAFLCCRNVGKVMLQQKRGSIINVSSISSLIAVHPNTQAHYHAAKGGLNSMTRALAFEWAPYGVRVNALILAYMKSPVVNTWVDDMWKHWSPFMPIGRLGEPEEVKGPILYMASDASTFMTGSMVTVDGGYTMV